jgi:hypothetical protein
MGYIQDVYEGKATTMTATWRPATKEDCEENIIRLAKSYANKKWWDSGRYYLKEIKFWVRELENINQLN